MIDLVPSLERDAVWLVWAAVGLAASMALAVVGERIAGAAQEARFRRVQKRYGPLITRALAGDDGAVDELVKSPSRYRIMIARMLLTPLIYDRDPRHIAATRAIVRAMSVLPIADRFLRSWRWWRRSLALRVLGLIQLKDYTSSIVAALDDQTEDVRNAALDALADMQDPAALPAIVVRLHDASLHRGRRAAALGAYGSQCEPLLLDLSGIDPEHRVNYARALVICGTERSRPRLCQWTGDARVEVRAAAFEALARIGLDEYSAFLAIDALDRDDVAVRAMAAGALHGWSGAGDAASHLARHLDDSWTVAVRAARSLQSMRQTGLIQLEVCATRPDLAGVIAQQMLWEVETQR